VSPTPQILPLIHALRWLRPGSDCAAAERHLQGPLGPTWGKEPLRLTLPPNLGRTATAWYSSHLGWRDGLLVCRQKISIHSHQTCFSLRGCWVMDSGCVALPGRRWVSRKPHTDTQSGNRRSPFAFAKLRSSASNSARRHDITAAAHTLLGEATPEPRTP